MKAMLPQGKYAHSPPPVFWGGAREGKKGWVNPPLPRHWEGWLFLALYKSSDIYFNIYWALIYSSLRLGRVWHADVADALPRRIVKGRAQSAAARGHCFVVQFFARVYCLG